MLSLIWLVKGPIKLTCFSLSHGIYFSLELGFTPQEWSILTIKGYRSMLAFVFRFHDLESLHRWVEI